MLAHWPPDRSPGFCPGLCSIPASPKPGKNSPSHALRCRAPQGLPGSPRRVPAGPWGAAGVQGNFRHRPRTPRALRECRPSAKLSPTEKEGPMLNPVKFGVSSQTRAVEPMTRTRPASFKGSEKKESVFLSEVEGSAFVLAFAFKEADSPRTEGCSLLTTSLFLSLAWDTTNLPTVLFS